MSAASGYYGEGMALPLREVSLGEYGGIGARISSWKISLADRTSLVRGSMAIKASSAIPIGGGADASTMDSLGANEALVEHVRGLSPPERLWASSLSLTRPSEAIASLLWPAGLSFSDSKQRRLKCL